MSPNERLFIPYNSDNFSKDLYHDLFNIMNNKKLLWGVFDNVTQDLDSNHEIKDILKFTDAKLSSRDLKLSGVRLTNLFNEIKSAIEKIDTFYKERGEYFCMTCRSSHPNNYNLHKDFDIANWYESEGDQFIKRIGCLLRDGYSYDDESNQKYVRDYFKGALNGKKSVPYYIRFSILINLKDNIFIQAIIETYNFISENKINLEDKLVNLLGKLDKIYKPSWRTRSRFFGISVKGLKNWKNGTKMDISNLIKIKQNLKLISSFISNNLNEKRDLKKLNDFISSLNSKISSYRNKIPRSWSNRSDEIIHFLEGYIYFPDTSMRGIGRLLNLQKNFLFNAKFERPNQYMQLLTIILIGVDFSNVKFKSGKNVSILKQDFKDFIFRKLKDYSLLGDLDEFYLKNNEIFLLDFRDHSRILFDLTLQGMIALYICYGGEYNGNLFNRFGELMNPSNCTILTNRFINGDPLRVKDCDSILRNLKNLVPCDDNLRRFISSLVNYKDKYAPEKLKYQKRHSDEFSPLDYKVYQLYISSKINMGFDVSICNFFKENQLSGKGGWEGDGVTRQHAEENPDYNYLIKKISRDSYWKTPFKFEIIAIGNEFHYNYLDLGNQDDKLRKNILLQARTYNLFQLILKQKAGEVIDFEKEFKEASLSNLIYLNKLRNSNGFRLFNVDRNIWSEYICSNPDGNMPGLIFEGGAFKSFISEFNKRFSKLLTNSIKNEINWFEIYLGQKGFYNEWDILRKRVEDVYLVYNKLPNMLGERRGNPKRWYPWFVKEHCIKGKIIKDIWGLLLKRGIINRLDTETINNLLLQ